VSWQTTQSAGLASQGTGLRVTGVSEDGNVVSALANLNVVLRSVDGGENWTSSGAIDPTSADGLALTVQGTDARVLIGSGGVFVSEDGGQAWVRLTLPAGLDAMSSGLKVRRVDAQTWLATDASGSAHLTTDKGANWRVVVTAWQGGVPPSVAFRDAKNGLMVDDKGRLLASQDGGASWQLRRADFGAVGSLQFVSRQVGWLVGSDGRLNRSSDGGESWQTAPMAQDVAYSSVRFEDDKLGWARRGGGQALFITQDGGQTWAQQQLPAAVISMRLGAQAWVAAGSAGALYVSRDKGATWTVVPSGTSADLQALTFAEARTIWAASLDGTLVRSDDAGMTWSSFKPAGSKALHDIKFANARVGWVVGDDGLVMATIDGGTSWHLQTSGAAAALSGIQVVDASTAWITGAGGVLLATGNGGR
jgi:photosystem II stability/assembly factor-like uncharacterized protein